MWLGGLELETVPSSPMLSMNSMNESGSDLRLVLLLDLRHRPPSFPFLCHICAVVEGVPPPPPPPPPGRASNDAVCLPKHNFNVFLAHIRPAASSFPLRNQGYSKETMTHNSQLDSSQAYAAPVPAGGRRGIINKT